MPKGSKGGPIYIIPANKRPPDCNDNVAASCRLFFSTGESMALNDVDDRKRVSLFTLMAI